MHCYQNDTNYDYKYWYRQINGEGPVLIASIIGTAELIEKGFDTGFKVSSTETVGSRYISSLPGSSVEMHCYQNDTNYDYKYWYRQITGEQPVLIGSYIVNSGSNEKEFETGFIMSDFSDGVLITQWPNYISSLPGSSVEMHCYQNDTDYDYKYWYRQIKGEGPVLIGSYNFNSPSNEKGFETGFTMSGTETKKWTLTVDVKEGIDAVYLCAASRVNNYDPAYFGNGTKLTVLDPDVDINKPDVKILNETRCKEKVTLVCLAENFYPDHVSIKWTVGSKNITEDVATDPYATQDEKSKMFRISSRLKVPKNEFTPKSTFKCTVTFYRATDVSDDESAEITGTGGAGYEPEDYLKSSKMMKLAYGVFIAKSALYGLVIFVFVLRKIFLIFRFPSQAANVTLPKVKILPPSPKEICSQDKINDKRSTLVCVASGFYPDHVSVSWKVNGVERQDSVSTDTSQDKINDKRSTLVCVASGFYPDHMSVSWKVNGVERQDSVSTDTSAQQDKTTLMYHISSRIKVNGTDWMDPKRSFACTVHFFNGDEYVNVTNTINGQKVKPKGLKLLGFGYILFLSKSLLYALVVAGVVCKLKFSAKKKQLPED
ncbi:uncharacterized protein LOC107664422 [Sinocyclocheilus anshuiensis]|uniref:uncharacterized protein LOC107664422 n=1 Tax=Sinocyclocheilus anshuiensis TaxID=1608454 RepID=UPI0007BA9ED8|nr:PREDICTED: uncharacterized protein LOC107664422 [Sinocyclocheilus anshuiensis]